MNAACSECRFWSQSDVAGASWGDCRRWAPSKLGSVTFWLENHVEKILRAHISGRDEWAANCTANACRPWPVTEEHEWCGEFEPQQPT